MNRTEYVEAADGTKIAFERHGDGDEVVVLVEPPLHHRGMSAFTGLVPLLAERLTVVEFDRRGRGASGDTPPYHPDREVDDLAAVITAVGGRAGVFGYSGGALLALRAASDIQRISSLVLLEPPLRADDDPVPDPLTHELTQLIAAGDRAGAVTRFHEAIGVPAEYVAEMALAPSWSAMVDVAHTIVYDCTLADSIDTTVLDRVAAPTLVLDSEGSSDDLTGWAASVADRLPNASHRSLPGEWHTVDDDVLAAAILDHVLSAPIRER